MLVVAIPTLVHRAALLLRGHGALARRDGAADLGRSLSRARRAAVARRADDLRLESHVDARRLSADRARAAAHALLSRADSCKKLPPIGIIGGLIRIFWTVPQEFPEKRREIFKRADRILRETGDSVYLSPEGDARHDGRDRPLQQRLISSGDEPPRADRSDLLLHSARRSIPAWATTRSRARSTSTSFRRSTRRRGGSPISSGIATRSATCSCACTTRCARLVSFPNRSRLSRATTPCGRGGGMTHEPATLVDLLRSRAEQRPDASPTPFSSTANARARGSPTPSSMLAPRDRGGASRAWRAAGRSRAAPLSAGTRLHPRVLRLSVRRCRRGAVVSAATRASVAHAAATARIVARCRREHRAVERRGRRRRGGRCVVMPRRSTQSRGSAPRPSTRSSLSAWDTPSLGDDPLAFLQYTSGSTASPKGVMVSHANLLHNLAYANHAAENDDDERVRLVAAGDSRHGAHRRRARADVRGISGVSHGARVVSPAPDALAARDHALSGDDERRAELRLRPLRPQNHRRAARRARSVVVARRVQRCRADSRATRSSRFTSAFATSAFAGGRSIRSTGWPSRRCSSRPGGAATSR